VLAIRKFQKKKEKKTKALDMGVAGDVMGPVECVPGSAVEYVLCGAPGSLSRLPMWGYS